MTEHGKLGAIIPLSAEIGREMETLHELTLESCQVSCWDDKLFTDVNLEAMLAAAAKQSVEITAIWTGYPGQNVWNFVEGPSTIGLVPPELRARRVRALKAGADFARRAEVGVVVTHAGFIPEFPGDPLYAPTIDALREVAQHCADQGLKFAFETGQETPITLLRGMTDIGTDNLGVNLDPANLLLYGKANPVDALDILGPWVVGVHAKDGEYPTNPRELGKEQPLGQGRVDYPCLLERLRSLGYRGALTIEREISGPQQTDDIRKAIALLRTLW